MTTITAKELRDNLGEITKKVRAGEHIIVSYRNKPSFRLEPLEQKTPLPDPLSGLKKYLEKVKKADIPERYKTGDLKQLYREDMAKKHGITE